MSRYRHAKRHTEQAELDVTTFLNLMVVLIPFLLVTAVFSRITIQELNLPTEAAGGANPDKPLVTIEVIMRKENLQIGDGKGITATIPMRDGKYDIKRLSEMLLSLKGEYSEKEDATLLIEPDIEYEDLIHVMDAVKVAEVMVPGQVEIERVVLFPQLSLGDAP
jgi:biopolymer transport protein ExbD